MWSSHPAGVPARARGLLFVVSAPSGTGKTTVVEHLVHRTPRLKQSTSFTSRSARAGEVDGVDYNFVSRDRFEAMVRQDAFLEWADIFGNLYGTGREATEQTLAGGIDLVLVIDVQGARQVRRQMPEAVAIFVLPPTFETLAARLRGRNKDSAEAIERRLETARGEVDAVDEYDYVVVNDELDRCVEEIDAIVAAERARLSRRRQGVEPIIATFRTGAHTGTSRDPHED
jgi:guanylate kinase